MKRISLIQGIKFFLKAFIVKFSKSDFGNYDKTTVIGDGCFFYNPSNIFLGDHVNIGSDATLYAANASIVIKKYFVSAKGLKISTGQHERRIGRFLASITEKEKNHQIGLDEPVIINEDVWAGFNVTIMAGVEIGRGCTLAAGSVVTKSTPPYSIVGGVPARFIKFYWSIDQILRHEEMLYSPNERFSREQLSVLFNKYSKDY